MTKQIKCNVTFLFVLTALLLTISCSGQPAQITVDMSANGSAVTMEQGQELVVRLESNPTTGYGWTVQNVDTAVLQQVGDIEYEPADTGLVGSGGWESCRFQALSSGETTLQMIYHRSWEENVDPEQTFTLTVTVR